MKKIVMIFQLAALLLVPFAGRGQELPFADGEELQYTVYYKSFLVKADLASLKMTGTLEPKGYHVAAHVATFRFWDTFYQMRDLYESWFTLTPALMPLSYHRDVKEGKYWAKNWFEWKEDGRTIHEITEKRRGRRDTVVTCPSITRDIIGAIYFLRAADYEAMERGIPAETMMTLDRDIFLVSALVAGREVTKVEGVSYNTVKVAVTVRPHDVDNNEMTSDLSLQSGDNQYSQIFFWITDDENRIPIRFSVELGKVGGTAQGRLVRMEGLKYPLTSKIQK